MKNLILILLVSMSSAALGDPKIRPLGPSDIDPADPFKGLDENNEADIGKFFSIEDSFHKLEKPLTIGTLELVAWMERPAETLEQNPEQRIELFLRNKQTSEEGWLSLIKGERYEGITFAQLEYHSGFFPEVDGEPRKLGQTKTLSLGIASGKPNNFVILRTFNGKMMEVFFWAKPASATQVRPSSEDNGEQDGADQPATATESGAEGNKAPKPASEVRPQ